MLKRLPAGLRSQDKVPNFGQAGTSEGRQKMIMARRCHALTTRGKGGDWFLSGTACVRRRQLELHGGATCSGVRRFHLSQENLPCAIG
ncbi:hypothetical protein D3C85_1488970 [compost metagenome]